MSDADQPGLFDELLGAPDRDLCPGARPVLSVGPDDEPDYLANLCLLYTSDAADE